MIKRKKEIIEIAKNNGLNMAKVFSAYLAYLLLNFLVSFNSGNKFFLVAIE